MMSFGRVCYGGDPNSSNTIRVWVLLCGKRAKKRMIREEPFLTASDMPGVLAVLRRLRTGHRSNGLQITASYYLYQSENVLRVLRTVFRHTTTRLNRP